MEIEEESFEVFGSTDAPINNMLEKGRYKFTVSDISSFTSQAGNKCIKVTLNIEGKKLFDNLMVEGQMSWKWRQFLFAIGIRNKGTQFSVNKSKILGKVALADIGVKDRTLDDGSVIKENKIASYSPFEEEIAPIVGVEPEIPTETPPEDDL